MILATEYGLEALFSFFVLSALVCLCTIVPLVRSLLSNLVVPSVLGGKYAEDNIRKISLMELLAYSGDMARQIDNVPDGAQVKIVLKE